MTVSWLMLERYALGELSERERSEVELRLAESSEDRACLDAILNDATVLPPLPAVLPVRKRSGGALWWAGAAALAASFALTVVRPFDTQPAGDPGVKGGEVAITLISERTGVAAHSFRDGERFKLFVTCPPSLSSRMEVVMHQGGQRYQPLAGKIACGNQVPWPGAFSLDGPGDVEVCVSWGPADSTCLRLPHE